MIGIYTLLVLSTTNSSRAYQHRRIAREVHNLDLRRRQSFDEVLHILITPLLQLYCTILMAASLKIGRWQYHGPPHFILHLRISRFMASCNIQFVSNGFRQRSFTVGQGSCTFHHCDNHAYMRSSLSSIRNLVGKTTMLFKGVMLTLHSTCQQRFLPSMTDQNFDHAKLDQVVPLAKGGQVQFLLEKTISVRMLSLSCIYLRKLIFFGSIGK